MQSIVLDTNAYRYFSEGLEEILAIMGSSDRTYISSIVLGELFAGFFKGNKYEYNYKILERFLDDPDVFHLHVDPQTAKIFGQLKCQLEKQGTPIPLNDIWIAAHALQTNSMLVTYDKHFQHIQQLQLWKKKSS